VGSVESDPKGREKLDDLKNIHRQTLLPHRPDAGAVTPDPQAPGCSSEAAGETHANHTWQRAALCVSASAGAQGSSPVLSRLAGPPEQLRRCGCPTSVRGCDQGGHVSVGGGIAIICIKAEALSHICTDCGPSGAPTDCGPHGAENECAQPCPVMPPPPPSLPPQVARPTAPAPAYH
jgi:hypothetical protein